MKKTKNFETYVKESLDGLIPLDSQEIVISEEEEVDEFELEDDSEEDSTEESDDGEFELDTVPADEPVLEPEENLADANDETSDLEEEPLGMEDDMPDLLDDGDELLDGEAGLDMIDGPIEEGGNKTLYLYCGTSNIDDEAEPSNVAIEEITGMMQGCDCETIKVYQLNVQPVSDTEPADGMQMIYDKIKDADSIVMAAPIQDGSASSLTNLVLDRLAQHYQSGELQNKVFGSILAGDETGYQNVKSSLINKANNLGMIVAPSANILVGGEGADYQKFVDSISDLRDATSAIRAEVVEEPLADGIEDGTSDVMSFDDFTDAADDVADELGDQGVDGELSLDEPMEDDLPVDEPMEDEPMEDEPMEDEPTEDDNVINFADFDGMQDEESTEPTEPEFEETPEEEEIQIVEDKDWNLPEPPKELKNPTKIKTFKEATSSKKSNDFITKPASGKMTKGKVDTSKGKAGDTSIKKSETVKDNKDFIAKGGKSTMPKSSINVEQGKSKESTIKNKSVSASDKELVDGKGTSTLPKKSGKDTEGAKNTDSGVKVDVKYFKGMKGGQPKEQANKPGDTVQNFSDWTKRI